MNSRYFKIGGIIVISTLALLFILLNVKLSSGDLNTQDTNNNAIWDDIEPFIEKHAKTEYHRQALEQFFKAMQKNLLNPERCINIKNNTIPDDTQKAAKCIDLVGIKYGGRPEISDLEDTIVNSVPRSRAYNTFNSNCSGGFFGLWDEKTQGPPCEFKLE